MEHPPHNQNNLILLMIGAGLILLGVAAFLTILRAQQTVQTADFTAVPVPINFSAPNVRLTDLQGRPVSFSDYRGQVILYNAWATWCPPCKAEMPVLQAYYLAHQQEGFVVIAIEDGEPLSDVASFAGDNGLTFPVWPDTKLVATAAFGIDALPTSYVIDRNGAARLMWAGAITRDTLEQYVTPLLQGN